MQTQVRNGDKTWTGKCHELESNDRINKMWVCVYILYSIVLLQLHMMLKGEQKQAM